MTRRRVAIGLLILIAVAAFVGAQIYRWVSLEAEARVIDPWVTSWSRSDQAEQVPMEHFSLVRSANRDEAIRLLADVRVVDLADDDVRRLAPDLLPRPEGLNPYLVRGVFLEDSNGVPMGTGRFLIRHESKLLLVYFGALGSRPHPMRQGPLVIWLPFKPENVYVRCGMAQ
jgi:hypothetical protein